MATRNHDSEGSDTNADKGEAVRLARIKKFNDAVDNYIPKLKPEIHDHAFPYQLKQVAGDVLRLRLRGVSNNFSDTGTGKTDAANMTAKQIEADAVIVTTKQSIPYWCENSEALGVNVLAIANYESAKNGKCYKNSDDFMDEIRIESPYWKVHRRPVVDPMTRQPVLTKTGAQKTVIDYIEWFIPSGTMVIFDECHMGKNGVLSAGGSTGNNKFISSFRKYIDRTKGVYCLMLSATVTDKILNFDLCSYMSGMYDNYTGESYVNFLMRHGITTIESDDPNVMKHNMEIIKKMLYPMYASRMDIEKIKAENSDLSFFKNNDLCASAFITSRDRVDEIERAHIQIKILLEEMRIDPGAGLGRIVKQLVLIESIKAPVIAPVIYSDWHDEGFSPVLFVNYKKTLNIVYSYLVEKGVPPQKIGIIQGGQTSRDRATIVDMFAKDEIEILLCNAQAGGASLSAHDRRGVRARRAYHMPSWFAIRMKQSFGRVYRAGMKSDCVQRIIYVKPPGPNDGLDDETQDVATTSAPPVIAAPQVGDFNVEDEMTIEQMICNNVNGKIKNMSVFNDGEYVGVKGWFGKDEEDTDD